LKKKLDCQTFDYTARLIQVRQISVTQSTRPIQIIAAGDGPTLIFNTDTANTVYLGSDIGMNILNSDTVVPLSPLGSVVLDGRKDVYGLPDAANHSILVSVIEGGLSFFQQLNIISKIIEISGSSGNGLYVYDPSPGPGKLLASITDSLSDPFSNTTYRGIVTYKIGSPGIFIQLQQASINFGDPANVFGGSLTETPALGGPSGVPGLLLISPSNVSAAGLNSQAAIGVVGESSDRTNGPFLWHGALQIGSSNVLSVPTIFVGPLGFSAGGVPGGALTSDTNLYRSAAGVLRTDKAFAITSSALPSSIANAAVEYADSASNLKFVGGGDGIPYATGSFRVSMAAPQTSTAGFTEIDGFGVTVGGEAYIFDCMISGFKNTSAGTATIAFTGPAINYATLSIKVYDANTGTFLGYTTLGALTSYSTPSIGNGDTFAIEITGSISFSAAGFFQVQMINGSAATWRANTGSYFSLKPV
jgi:hypothetical protein